MAAKRKVLENAGEENKNSKETSSAKKCKYDVTGFRNWTVSNVNDFLTEEGFGSEITAKFVGEKKFYFIQHNSAYPHVLTGYI